MKHERDRGIGPVQSRDISQISASPTAAPQRGGCHRPSDHQLLIGCVNGFFSKLPLRKRMAVGLPGSGHHPPGPPCATSARLLLGARQNVIVKR
jgi:hypothetical protein